MAPVLLRAGHQAAVAVEQRGDVRAGRDEDDVRVEALDEVRVDVAAPGDARGAGAVDLARVGLAVDEDVVGVAARPRRADQGEVVALGELQ